MRRIMFMLLIFVLLALTSCINSNTPPQRPSNPIPNNGQKDVSLTPTLSWTASDPDGDALSFDIYFGTNSNPPLKETLTTKTYKPDNLNYNTTYYWKVIAKDDKDAKAEGPVWSFTTIEEPIEGTEKWKFETGNGINSSPAIGTDGTIYVGSAHELYAINSDGTKKWKYYTDGDVNSSPAIGADGSIYVGSDDGYLYAFNSDGSVKWKFLTTDRYSIWPSPAIGADGTIYVGSQDSYIYAINPDGTEKWKFKTNWSVGSSPAIGTDGTVYVGSRDYYLYAINPDGTEKWKFKTDYYIFSSPAIGADGTVYIGSYGGYLYAVNSTGSLKWKFKTKGSIDHSSPVIGSDGTIYICDISNYEFAGYLYAINPEDGALKWKFKTDNDILSSPAIGSQGLPNITTLAFLVNAIIEDGIPT